MSRTIRLGLCHSVTSEVLSSLPAASSRLRSERGAGVDSSVDGDSVSPILPVIRMEYGPVESGLDGGSVCGVYLITRSGIARRATSSPIISSYGSTSRSESLSNLSIIYLRCRF